MDINDDSEGDLFVENFEHSSSENESIDDGDDTEFDNENPNYSTEANKLQSKRLRHFMQEPKVSITQTQSHFKERWEKLSHELNSVGPPTFNASQWHLIIRQKCNQKYNHKIKQMTNAAGIAGASYQVEQSHSGHSADAIQNIELPPQQLSSTVNSYPQVLDKLNVIIEKEDAILKALERSNSFLQEICQCFKK